MLASRFYQKNGLNLKHTGQHKIHILSLYVTVLNILSKCFCAYFKHGKHLLS